VTDRRASRGTRADGDRRSLKSARSVQPAELRRTTHIRSVQSIRGSGPSHGTVVRIVTERTSHGAAQTSREAFQRRVGNRLRAKSCAKPVSYDNERKTNLLWAVNHRKFSRAAGMRAFQKHCDMVKRTAHRGLGGRSLRPSNTTGFPSVANDVDLPLCHRRKVIGRGRDAPDRHDRSDFLTEAQIPGWPVTLSKVIGPT
jgi:hypothetical protein